MDRTKVCWHCEADVSYEATYCPFCGADLLTSPSESTAQFPKSDGKFSDQTLQESLASLYKPPYSIRDRRGLGVPDEREEALFKQAEVSKENPLFHFHDQKEAQQPSEEVNQEEKSMRRGTILPLLFLMIGVHLFILGVLLLFCAREGVVTLEWSNRFWFIYCLASFPMLYFGVRLLKNLTV